MTQNNLSKLAKNYNGQNPKSSHLKKKNSSGELTHTYKMHFQETFALQKKSLYACTLRVCKSYYNIGVCIVFPSEQYAFKVYFVNGFTSHPVGIAILGEKMKGNGDKRRSLPGYVGPAPGVLV
jgi:hypothetical protein